MLQDLLNFTQWLLISGRFKDVGKGRVPCIIVNLAAARWMSGSVLLIKPEVRIAEYCL